MKDSEVFYHPVGAELDVFRHAHRRGLPLLLKGPTGCGKSRFVEAMANELGRPLITVACNDETSAADLLGRWLIRGGETVWTDGPATHAVRTGAILYLDEVAEAREDVIVVLHPLTDHRRTLHIDRLNESIAAAPGFQLVASFNPGYRRGMKELKSSTRQRFVALAFDYPSAAVETTIVCRETGAEKAIVEKLVVLARRIRGLTELGLAETVSTRLLVDAAHLIVSGLPQRTAIQAAIVQPLTDDGATARALQDVADLMF